MFEILIASFLGGLAINIMPCILPILPIKILGLTKIAKENYKERVILGCLNMAGSVLSFMGLALLLWAVRSFTGQFMTWGFQMQNPIFLSFIFIVLLLLALDSLEIIQFNWSFFQRVGIHGFSGKAGAFLDGAVTVALASPCCGPMLAGAISASFFMPIFWMLLSFSVMGIGLACPFFIAALLPSTVSLIPKPGKWMNTVKKLSGVGILILALWVLGMIFKILAI